MGYGKASPVQATRFNAQEPGRWIGAIPNRIVSRLLRGTEPNLGSRVNRGRSGRRFAGRGTGMLAGAMLASWLWPVVTATDQGDAGAQLANSGPSETELELFDLANADRTERELPTLEFAPALLRVARERAVAQIQEPRLNQYTGSGAIACAEKLNESAFAFSRAGENLARTRTAGETVPGAVETALMESRSHARNILDPGFDYLAIGAVQDGHGNTIVAQIFVDTVGSIS
jgi:uncharacterized protein YkwD